MQEAQQLQQYAPRQADLQKPESDLKSGQYLQSQIQNQTQQQPGFGIKKVSRPISQCLFCLISTVAILFIVTACGLSLLLFHSQTNNSTDNFPIEKPSQTSNPAKPSSQAHKYPHSPISPSQTFTNISHNTYHFPNLHTYLQHNKAHKILQLYKNKQQFENPSTYDVNQEGGALSFQFVSKEEEINGLLEKSVSMGTGEDDEVVWGERYDWIEVWDVFSFVMMVVDKSKDIGLLSKYGISIRIPKGADLRKGGIDNKLKQYFTKINLIYEQPKSLSLTQTHAHPILIFLTYKNSSSTPPLHYSSSLHSSLAIHSVLRLTQNIPYLRQWIGYHVNIGFTKIFIYDNTNSQKSQLTLYDGKVTHRTNKNGMSLECVDGNQEQVWGMWREIWEEYYWNIVYVRWEPRGSDGRVIYGQTEALENYVEYFSGVCKFTAFIDPDQFIFSPSNEKIIDYLNLKATKNITSLKLRSTHFLSRFCSPYSRVTETKHYFPSYQSQTKIIWSSKIIALTKYFKPNGIHDGSDTTGIQETAPSTILRINHYNFDYWALKEARENKLSGAEKFKEDDSMGQMYGGLIDQICKKGCSENFALKCPKGKQYKYCLKSTDTFPKNLNLTSLQLQLQSQTPPNN